MNDLQKEKVWVNWWFDPKRGKVPINSRTGGNAMSDNPQTWNYFQMAKAQIGRYDGVGLMFANLGIENAPAEAGARMELHHRVFKQVFDIATKNTR